MAGERRVVWVSFAPLRRTANGFSSDVASVRYRLLIPARAIPGSKVTHIGPGANRRTLLERFEGARAAVLGKLFAAGAGELVAPLKERGIKVIADYCDDHFSHPALGAGYRAAAAAADRVVASTAGLADVLREHTATPIVVVTDPVEGACGVPRASTGRPPQLLWFGNPVNLDALRFALPQLGECSLTVLTADGAGAERLGHRFRAWSTAALFEELGKCEAVVIPSNAHDPHKAVKSANRFTEALWAGRFVIAHPLPAYQELAGFGWVGEDLGDGLAWLAHNTEEALARIHAGQAWVAQHCSPEAVGRAWAAAIDAT